MAREFRRVVTGHDAQGKSVVIIDGPPVRGNEVWNTDGAPADNTGSGDTANRPMRLEPTDGGSGFRYFTLPPDNPNISREELEKLVARQFEAMGATHCRVDTTRHPAMHKTRTVDYVILLSGEVTLILDKGEVNLKPFDVVVQRGTNHAWSNRGKEPALLAAVLVDAKPV